MAIGRETFGLTKGDYGKKLGKILKNFRANCRLIGEPKEFVLRSCRLTEQWSKLANDPDVVVYLRNWEIAAGRKVKMVVLERGGTKQPVPKAKLLDALYPPRRRAEKATPELTHYHLVKAAMRGAVAWQLRDYRDSIELPITCLLTGKKIRPGMRTDVDHVGVCFSELADRFIAEKGLTYADITLKGPPTARVFTDTALWADWVAYHQEHARFSLVCASANRSKGAEDYKTCAKIIGNFSTENPEVMSLDF